MRQGTQKEEIIKNIMDDFDFEEVHRVIVFLNWRWLIANKIKIPNIKQIKQRARELLEDILSEKDIDYAATGGFIAQKNKERVTLLFRVTESNYEIGGEER